MDVVLLFSFEPERRHKALKIVQLSIDRLYKNKMFFMGSDSEPFHLLLRTGTCPLSTNPEYIFQPGKQPVKVKAKSLFCYWAVRELGFTMAYLAPQLNISQPAVSMSVQRGERIASENGYSLMDE